MSIRPNWYQDDSNRGFRITPLSQWRGVDLLMLVLAVFQLLGAFVPAVVEFLMLQPAHLSNPLRWYELVTYSLVHSRHDILHLLWNLLYLFFFGRQVEAMIGGRNAFLKFALAAALASSLTYLVIETVMSGAASPLLGASGIGFACLVAFATLMPNAEVLVLFIPVRAWVLASVLMLISVYSTAMSSGSGVAHVAHFGGGAFGFLFIRYRHLFGAMFERAREHRHEARREREGDKRREMDRILEKISQHGLNSLTRAERRFLDAASKDLRNGR